MLTNENIHSSISNILFKMCSKQRRRRSYDSEYILWTSLMILLLQLLLKGTVANSFEGLACPCCPRCTTLHLRHQRRVTDEEPWIWERRPSERDIVTARHTGLAAPTTVIDRFNKHPTLSNTYDPFELKDEKTQRNCPPVLFEEMDSSNNENFDQGNFDSFNPHFLGHDYRHHHHHNHHHYHHNHHPFYGDEIKPKFGPFADSSEEYNTDDSDHNHNVAPRPIIYPDDERWRPFSIHVPKTDTVTSTIASSSTAKSAIETTEQSQPSDQENRNQTNADGIQPSLLASVSINSPQCGVSVNSRIFGGTQALPGQFPWITRIAYLNTTDNRISYRCSGSVISERYILTAAHCVVNLVNDVRLSHVRIGDDPMTSASSNGSSIEDFQIESIIAHPSYDQPIFANDIALLRISIPEAGKGLMATICLPLIDTPQLMVSLIGSTGIVAGWSTTKNGVEMTNATVRYLRLPIVNTTECAITYAKFSENFRNPIVVAPSHLCAQGQSNNDVCRGDSGGPFMDDGTSGLINSNGRYTLLGIVAFGPSICGVSEFPGVYTRVSSFISWIRQNVQ